MATEKRLIELIECLERCSCNTDCESCSRWLYPCDEHCVDDLLATAAKELKKLVDAVEVVRCKDCFANGCCSVQIDLDMGDEGYCPKGRKEN